MWLCDYFYGWVTICNVCHEEEIKKSKAVLLTGPQGYFGVILGRIYGQQQQQHCQQQQTVCKALCYQRDIHLVKFRLYAAQIKKSTLNTCFKFNL